MSAPVQNQLPVLEAHVHILGFHARNVGEEKQLLRRFDNVHARRERDRTPSEFRSSQIGFLFSFDNAIFCHVWFSSRITSMFFVRTDLIPLYSVLTTIFRGLAASVLGMVMVS